MFNIFQHFSLILSFLPVALVVRDTDGSAFITKAEFDSLKNNFQAQIDNYNTSIDSKIDGAIAAYLAGVKLSSAVYIDNLSYTEDGILSLTGTATDGKWIQGRMSITGEYSYTRSGATGGTLYWKFKSKPSESNYSEWLIRNRSGSTSAEFVGYYDTRIKAKFYAIQCVTSSWKTDYQTKFSAVYHVLNRDATWPHYLSRNNTDLAASGDSLLNFIHGPGDALTQGTANLLGKYFSFERSKISAKLLNVVLADYSVDWRAFSEDDRFYDWETDLTGLSYVSFAPELSTDEAWTCTAQCYVGGGISVATTVQLTSNNTKSYTPWIGPTTKITNWNQIYKGGTDTLSNEIKSINPSWSGLTGSDSKQYLPINSGCPINYFEKDVVVMLPLEFQDKTKNYDVWVKIGPFTGNTATQGTLSPTEIDGASQSPSYTNAIRVNAGAANISFTMPSNNYVFIKWSIAGASPIGGGVWLPSRQIEYVKPN